MVTRRVAEKVRAETHHAVVQRYGRRLLSLILTGSMARQEETVVDSGDMLEVLGDAEFLLVFPRKFGVPRDPDIREMAREISNTLQQQGIRCRVDLATVWPSFLKELPKHIFTYELRHNGRVVFGDSEILHLIQRFPPKQIDREDAWRILSNRLIEWLESVAEVSEGQSESLAHFFYSSVKLYLDTATSLLVFLESYEPTYSARAERLNALAETWPHPSALPVSLVEFASHVRAATCWKLSPDAAGAVRDNWPFCISAVQYACRLWSWELCQIAGLSTDLPPLEIVRQWNRSMPFGRRYRGWLRVAREAGWRRSRDEWFRWLRMARYGSPRHWIYALAAECAMFGEDFPMTTRMNPAAAIRTETLYRFLPTSGGRERLDVSDWRQFVRDLGWNYHKFVEKTRS